MFEGKTALVLGVANKRSIAWGIAKRLAEGGATCAFTFQGERIEKSYDDDGSGPDPAVVTHFAYDRGNAWADLDTNGNLLTRRLYEDALDSEFARIGSGGSVDPRIERARALARAQPEPPSPACSLYVDARVRGTRLTRMV